MDKRIQKSKQMLQAALLELLREEGFENIEIQAITERADTARVTFYRHYGTKEELLLDVLENIYQGLQIQFGEMTAAQVLDLRLIPPSYFLFSFLESDRALHKKLLTGSVSALILSRLRHYIVQQVLFSLQKEAENLPIDLIANQIASILIGNIMWWLGEDIPYSAEHMARLSHSITIAGIMSIIGRHAEVTLPPESWEIK